MNLGAFAIDSLQGMGEIVAFQQEARRGNTLDQLSDQHIALRKPFFRELTMQQALLEIFTGLGGLATVIVGGVLALDGVVDAAILPLLTILAMAAFLPVSEIAQVGRAACRHAGCVHGGSTSLFNEPVPVTDGPAWRCRKAGVIGFAGRDLQYPGQARRPCRVWILRSPRRRPWRWSAFGCGQDHGGATADAVLGSRIRSRSA